VKIAAFDSGIGGLTAVAPLLKYISGLEITYLGDLANLPYGTKSPERIRALAQANADWLLASDRFDLFVVACNTASARALDLCNETARRHGTRAVGVIDPGCRRALALKAQRIVVLATGATVESGAYPARLRELGFQGEIRQQACPLFVPLVEDDLLEGAAVDEIVRRYLDPVVQTGDAVILGCTHYPILSHALARAYPSVSWIDAGGALLAENVVRAGPGPSKLRLLFTDSVGDGSRVHRFLERTGLEGLDAKIEIVPPVV
jgi:glutamate racemase